MLSNTEIVSNEISIIIQGGITDAAGNLDSKFIENLDATLNAMRGCEIIVSTWKASPEIEFYLSKKYPEVIFIFSDDVGSLSKVVNGVEVISNINRMLVSSINGLNSASKMYAIKIRTDSYFYNDNIIHLFNDYFMADKFCNVEGIKREKEFIVFNRHLINCNLFARNPFSHLPFLYHPGDILLAGLRKDLLNAFNIPLAEPDIFEYRKTMMNACYMKYVPEQYLWVKNIERDKKDFRFDGNFSYEKKEKSRSECFYVNNFLPVDSEGLGFIWRKHKEVYFNKGWSSIYQSMDWENLYRKYILKTNPINNKVLYIRSFQIVFMKIYFFFRTQVLKLPYVRKFAFKVFVKRGS